MRALILFYSLQFFFFYCNSQDIIILNSNRTISTDILKIDKLKITFINRVDGGKSYCYLENVSSYTIAGIEVNLDDRDNIISDFIVFPNDDTIYCKITEISHDIIFYNINIEEKRTIDLSKSPRSIKSFYFKPLLPAIVKNDSFSGSSNSDLAIKGQFDALRNYNGYVGAGTVTLVIGLLSPIVGLIPAIACSSTAPKEINLNYPDADLMKKTAYYNGYTQKAKKIKQGKVWKNLGIAFGANLIAVFILLH